jgi:hypothetical protein
MNTSQPNKNRFALSALLALTLTLLVPAALIGATPNCCNAEQVKTMAAAKDIKPDSTVMMVCSSCKTVKLSQFGTKQTNGRPPLAWMEIGTKHECGSCGGTITVVDGKTTDEMQHNCSKCGEGAAFCCVAHPDKT